MTATPESVTRSSGLKVINLMVIKEGKFERKMPNVKPQAQLNNRLLEALCPGIRLASVTVTSEPLDQVERSRVESAPREPRLATRFSDLGLAGKPLSRTSRFPFRRVR